MSKHTKGPWEAYIGEKFPRRRRTLAVVKGRRPAGNLYEVVHWGGFDHSDASEAESIANVRLISAAPELLEGCRSALMALSALAPGRAGATEDFLRAAIAKATGEDS